MAALLAGLTLAGAQTWSLPAARPCDASELSELTAEIGWQVREGWWATAHARHDIEENRAQKAGFGMTYQNECIAVELAASRRFTDTAEVDPETDVGLSVRLGGFGQKSDGKGTVARRACMR